MESLYVWLFLFAGVLIATLGMLLFVSERELKKKRRELKEAAANDRALELRTARTEAAEWAAKNRELSDQVSSLSTRLEQSQKTIDELQTEHHRLAGAQSETERLEAAMVNLRTELEASEARFMESAVHTREAAECNGKLQSEIAELTQRLEASQTSIVELQTGQELLLQDSESDKQKLCAENQQLQQEMADLRNQLQSSETALAASAAQCAELTDRCSQSQSDAGELRKQLEEALLKNGDISQENSSLSSKLAESQRTVEELLSTQEVERSENRDLESKNHELQRDLAKLNLDFQTSENRLAEAATEVQDSADRISRLQNEMAGMKEQLRSSQTQIEELRAEQERLAGVDSENQKLRQESADLQEQLQTSEGRAGELRKQSQEAADRCRQLETEVNGLQLELEQTQPKLRGLMALEEQLANAASREAAYKDRQYELERQITELQQELSQERDKVKELDAARKRLAEMECVNQGLRSENRPLEEEVNGSTHSNDERARLASDYSPSEMAAGKNDSAAPAVRARKRKGRAAVITAVIALGVAGAMGVFGTKYFRPTETAAGPETVADKEPMLETASQTVETKPPLAVQGKFKITRSTEVYSGPTESSALITRIQPGIKINVVGSRDGWLEIRSKYGRPPGYVRQETAVKID